ncbi:hypothetical protein [Paenibacillus oceani]|uniref:Uncharacterized protein n=1 Tax=Paenibacillus oceani TaxID=2772510 RepID=A0A927H2D4_9BACL|nr:hypothetical protein [Paenibacillus oceani]MBD2865715.1 hypothetical protein [Paenibacillus oceani]
MPDNLSHDDRNVRINKEALPGGAISRRSLLSAIGIAGIALTSQSLIAQAGTEGGGMSVLENVYGKVPSNPRFQVCNGTLDLEHDLGFSQSTVNDISLLVRAITEGKSITSGPGTFEVAGTLSATAGCLLWESRGTTIKLSAGAKTGPLFSLSNMDAILISGSLTLDGNKANVSGNNAGFFALKNVRYLNASNISFVNLRRYGFSCIDDITKPLSNLEFHNVKDISSGVTGSKPPAANGEVIKADFVGSLVIDGFQSSNPDGTGDGQKLKCFYGRNVSLHNIEIADASPSLFYPAISLVRNDNSVRSNVRIAGACKYAFEDNANRNSIYENIVTDYTPKALLAGTHGGSQGARRSENIFIRGWLDSSTNTMAFSLLGCNRLNIEGITTPQKLNLSRDSVANDRRCENVDIRHSLFGDLTLSLVMGYRRLTGIQVTGTLLNSGPGTLEAENVSYATYTESGGAQLSVLNRMTLPVRRTFSLAAGESESIVLNKAYTIEPFAGVVWCTIFEPSSPSTKWSQMRFDFYDYGGPNVVKSDLQSGSSPRNEISLATARSSRTITITNGNPSPVIVNVLIQAL